jgi:hypothetical protein
MNDAREWLDYKDNLCNKLFFNGNKRCGPGGVAKWESRRCEKHYMEAMLAYFLKPHINRDNIRKIIGILFHKDSPQCPCCKNPISSKPLLDFTGFRDSLCVTCVECTQCGRLIKNSLNYYRRADFVCRECEKKRMERKRNIVRID